MTDKYGTKQVFLVQEKWLEGHYSTAYPKEAVYLYRTYSAVGVQGGFSFELHPSEARKFAGFNDLKIATGLDMNLLFDSLDKDGSRLMMFPKE